MSEKDFRILLDVCDLYLENFKYVWINVSPYELKTIYDLKKCILHKINLKSDIELFVRNGLLLDDETIGVLRENDTVQIKFKPPVCENLQTESLKESASFSRKRNLSEINISNENISLKRHKPGIITLSSNRHEDNFSEKEKRIKQAELPKDPEHSFCSTSAEGELQTCKKKKNLVESDVSNDFEKNSRKEKGFKQTKSAKDPKHYFCSTSVEQEIEQINITDIFEKHHSNLTEKNQIRKSNRNLVKIDATNKNISVKIHNPHVNAMSPIGNVDNSSEKKYKKGKRKKQIESSIDSEYYFPNTVISKTKEISSISSENLCSISVDAEEEQLDIAKNFENNSQNLIEENQTHKKSHKKNKINKSPFMYDQTVTDINLCNNNDLLDSCTVEFIPQNQKEKDKSSKTIPLETEKETISNDSSSKAEKEKLNFHHGEFSSVVVTDMNSEKLNDNSLLETKKKRRRRRRRKKSSTIAEDNADVNLTSTSKSYSDKINENINRKHILYLSPDRNKRNDCLNDASEIHNPSTDTFVLNKDNFSSIPSDYPKMSTPIVILKSNFSSNESSLIVKNNLDVNTINISKPHSECIDEDVNREDILYLSPKNQEISLNNESNSQNTSTDTFAYEKDKFSTVPLNYPKLSAPSQENSCYVPVQLTLLPSKNCNLSSDSNEPVLHDEPASKSTLQTNRKRKSKKTSYEDLPDVISLPDVGTCIAYKVIELSENYTPTLTDYRVGVIESINLETQEVEIRLNKEIILPGRVGKFENLKEGEVPEPIMKTHDILKWSNVASPKLMSLIE